MLFVGIAGTGVGVLLIWAAIANESPTEVVRSVLRNEPRRFDASGPDDPDDQPAAPDPLAPIRPVV